MTNKLDMHQCKVRALIGHFVQTTSLLVITSLIEGLVNIRNFQVLHLETNKTTQLGMYIMLYVKCHKLHRGFKSSVFWQSSILNVAEVIITEFLAEKNPTTLVCLALH